MTVHSIYFDDNYLYETGKLKVVGYFSIAMKTMKVPVIETMSNSLRKNWAIFQTKSRILLYS